METNRTEVRRQFGRRLKELRLSRGLTQGDMAYALGIQAARYNKYEIGRSEAPYDILIKISRLTGISLDHLICGERDLLSRGTEHVDKLVGGLLDAIPIPAVVYDKADRLIAHNKPYQEDVFANHPTVIRPGTPHETVLRAWAYSNDLSPSEAEELVRQRASQNQTLGSLADIQIANKRLKIAESRYGDYRLVLVMEISDLQLSA